MGISAIDPLQLLTNISQRPRFQMVDKWINSQNSAIKNIRLGPRGDLGEEYIELLCRQLGANVQSTQSRTGEHDVIIGNRLVEVKTATEDVHNNFQFNLIRTDYKYDFLLCLGIAPNNILFNIYRHEDVTSMEEGPYILHGCADSVLPGHMTPFRTPEGTLNYKLTKRFDELRSIDELPYVLRAFQININEQNTINENVIPSDILLGLIREDRYSISSIWDNAAFTNIYLAENTATGQIGEVYVEELAKSFGFKVVKENYTGVYDLEINDFTFEIKTACKDTNGAFQFNNVRTDYKYDFLLCLGIAPNNILFNIYRHEDVTSMEEGPYILHGCADSVLPGHMTGMARAAAMEDNFKLTKRPNELRNITEFNVVLNALFN